MRGRIDAIRVAPGKGLPMQSLDSAQLVRGRGIEGDYRAVEGVLAENELTLIESEVLKAVEREFGFTISHADSRRNLLSSGIRLNELVGVQFQIGLIRVLGVELCEPCNTLQKRLNQPVLKALLHRGGLRARILKGGRLECGASFSC